STARCEPSRRASPASGAGWRASRPRSRRGRGQGACRGKSLPQTLGDVLSVATTIGDVVAFKVGPRLDVDHRLDPGRAMSPRLLSFSSLRTPATLTASIGEV